MTLKELLLAILVYGSLFSAVTLLAWPFWTKPWPIIVILTGAAVVYWVARPMERISLVAAILLFSGGFGLLRVAIDAVRALSGSERFDAVGLFAQGLLYAGFIGAWWITDRRRSQKESPSRHAGGA